MNVAVMITMSEAEDFKLFLKAVQSSLYAEINKEAYKTTLWLENALDRAVMIALKAWSER